MPTILVAGILTTSLMSCAYVLFWLRDRRNTAILWIVGAIALAWLGAVLREVVPATAAIFLANVAVFVGLGCIVMACRALDARPASPTWLLGPSVLWVAACAVPAVLGDRQGRVILASALSAALMGRAVWELRRDRTERLRARLWLTVLMAVNGLAAVLRAVATALAWGVPEPGLASNQQIAGVTLWSTGFGLLTGFAVIALVFERQERALRQTAREDKLTGLVNRRHFDEALDGEFRLARQLNRPLALLLIDADFFKSYNDTNGHVAGDECLRTIARNLSSTFPDPPHVVARYGGEEFAVLLPDTGEEAFHLAEAARRGVSDLALPHAGSPRGRITISVGGASVIPLPGAEPRDLIMEADRCLYVAKRLGRDRVSMEPGVETGRMAGTMLTVVGGGLSG